MGRFSGFIMAHRKSNLERNNWAIGLLNLRPQDHVLELGFGPGVAIEKMSQIVTSGVVYGIDHSLTMFTMATKRNEKRITAGRVKLFHASVSALPSIPFPVEKVLDINSF